MLILLAPIIVLLVTAAAMAVIQAFNPNYRYHWLVAAGGALLAWITVWLLRLNLSHELNLGDWGGGLIQVSPGLLLDPLSWVFTLALATLTLAVILTEVVRVAEGQWATWAGILAIAALGMFAVMAANPLTLVMAWMVLDILDLLVVLLRVEEPEKQRGVILFFAASTLGTMLVLMANSLSHGGLSFYDLSPDSAVHLFLAVGLRLGILPLQAPFLRGAAQQRGLGTISKLVLPAASLILLVRTAETGLPQNYQTGLAVAIGLGAVYGAIAWARVRDELRGRRYWILGMGSLTLAAGALGQPDAALAWSLGLLYAGGLLFVFSVRERWMLVFGIFGLFGITSLPFSPSQAGALIFIDGFNPLLLVLILAHAVLILGYLKHFLRQGEPLIGVEPWIEFVYPIGLGVLPLTYWVSNLLYVPEEIRIDAAPIWPGLMAIGLGVVVGLFFLRGPEIPESLFMNLDAVFSLGWFYRLLGQVFTWIERLMRFVNRVLEGDAGVLWAFLLVILIVSILGQLGALVGGG